jgi:hypothetical protein
MHVRLVWLVGLAVIPGWQEMAHSQEQKIATDP